MIGLHVAILIVAFVLALLAGLEIKTPRVHLGWMAIALWILDVLLR